MKKNVTRVIALTLIALMCLALLPMAAFATEPETGVPPCEKHTWATDYTVDTPATCTAAGSKSIHCTVCGAIKPESETEIASPGHDWDEGVVTKPATCAEAGEKTYTCSVCNTTYVEAVDKLDHTWDKGVETKPATCEASGEKTYTCTMCNDTYTETIPALGHDWNNAEGVCVREGCDASHKHDTNGEGGVCSVCGYKAPEEEKKDTKGGDTKAPETVTVTFYSNDGMGKSAEQTETKGESKALTANSFTRYNHKFTGWNTQADGKGTDYADGAAYDFSADLSLYAQWEKVKADGTVIIYKTANTGGEREVINPILGEEYTLQTGFTADNMTVTGFNTAADGSGTAYAVGDKVTLTEANSTLTLFVQWGGKAEAFKTVVGSPSGPVVSGSTKKYTYDISLKLADDSTVPVNVKPTEAVPFTIPYPKGMTATSHTYSLKHVPDGKSVSITADSKGIHGSSKSFSDFELTATEADTTKLSVTIAPEKATPGTELKTTVTKPADATVTYQWNLDGTAISGATGSAYTVKTSDVGKKITCTVTDGSNSATSNAVTPTAEKTKPAAPTSPELKKHIYDGKPGMIIGLDTTMEYQAPGSDKWTPVTGSPMSVADGKEGTYKFRYAETDTTYASDPKSVTVRSYYTVLTAVNRGYGSFTDSTGSGYTTYSDQWVEKGTAYSALIYPARRYYVYSVIDNGKYMGYNRYYSIAKVNGPHTIIINFAGTDSPRTADDSNIPLWAVMCTVSLAGLGAVWMISRRRRKD